ncbi:hypothetical protein [Geobacter anodireducens]
MHLHLQQSGQSHCLLHRRLIILQSLGISITPVLTALGVGGLAVALALQDTLSNIFSGSTSSPPARSARGTTSSSPAARKDT